jgi:MFS family permease
LTASYGANLLILFGLGITWILDGIEITIVGAIAPVLRDQETLGLSAAQIGSSASAYVASAVVGALIFGWQPDRFGRRLVFLHRFDFAKHESSVPEKTIAGGSCLRVTKGRGS